MTAPALGAIGGTMVIDHDLGHGSGHRPKEVPVVLPLSSMVSLQGF
jgi:hypothetical protein